MAEKIMSSNLLALQNSLKKYLPGSLKVYGQLCSILSARWKGFEFWVDKWPDYTAVLSCPNKELYQTEYDNNVYSIFASEASGVETLLYHPDIVNWKKEIVFGEIESNIWDMDCSKRLCLDYVEIISRAAGEGHIIQTVQVCGIEAVLSRDTGLTISVSSEIWEIIKKASRDHGGKIEEPIEDAITVICEEKDLCPQEVPNEVTVESVTEDMSGMISGNWDYSGTGGEDFIRNIIQNLPSVCLRTSSGELIGYELVYPYWSVGFLYVMPNFRRKGYGKLIQNVLAKKLFKDNKSPWGYIDSSNKVSIDFHTKIGYRQIPNGRVSWLRHKMNSLESDTRCCTQKRCV